MAAVEGRLVRFLGRKLGQENMGVVEQKPLVLPRNLPYGLMARNYENAVGNHRNVIDSFVINVGWGELQQTTGASLTSSALSSLVSQLDWAASQNGTQGRPLRVRLRVLAGVEAPAWLKTSVGSMPYYAGQGDEAAGAYAPSSPAGPWRMMTRPMLKWWLPGAADAYENLQYLLASQIGDHPALGEVCMDLPCTQYAEPFIKQFGCLENRTSVLNAGWTLAKDDQAFLTGWTIHNDHWSPRGVATYTAYNPAEFPKDIGGGETKGRVDPARTVAMMAKKVEVLAKMAVQGNCSLQNPITRRGDPYTVQYGAQIAARASDAKQPIAFQTATLAKMQSARAAQIAAGETIPSELTGVNETIKMALEWKSTSVEPPSGYEKTTAPALDYVSPAMAAAYASQFYDNMRASSIA